MTRTIQVTGKSNVKVSPDHTRISLNLTGTRAEYDAALATSVKDLNLIVECIKQLGFERKELKTSRFEINRKTESYRDKNNDWKQRFVGYEYTQDLNFSFENDNARLGRILYALSHLCIVPEINISYFCGDVEAVKDQLLEIAIKDARKKAELLTRAAGVKICEILNIDYSWVNIALETDDMSFCKPIMASCSSLSYDVDIEPEDISTSDSVRITYRIE